jgi:hypothetical protein
MFRRHVLFASLAAATLCAARAFAADADDAVVVTATRLPQSGFDLPIAIDVVDKRRISEQTPRTAISETLNRLPGTLVQNRETLAQEQQITLRGFGARSQFGVRGIKLIADGIPAGTPDGQGGAGLFDLASAGRIEVLRGPFSALYGNHSGGVIQVFTENGPKRPELSADLLAGSHGGRRVMAKFAGDWDGVNAVAFRVALGQRRLSRLERRPQGPDERQAATRRRQGHDTDAAGQSTQTARQPRPARADGCASDAGSQPGQPGRARQPHAADARQHPVRRRVGARARWRPFPARPALRRRAQQRAVPRLPGRRRHQFRRRQRLRPRLLGQRLALDAKVGNPDPERGRGLRTRRRSAPRLRQQRRRQGRLAARRGQRGLAARRLPAGRMAGRAGLDPARRPAPFARQLRLAGPLHRRRQSGRQRQRRLLGLDARRRRALPAQRTRQSLCQRRPQLRSADVHRIGLPRRRHERTQSPVAPEHQPARRDRRQGLRHRCAAPDRRPVPHRHARRDRRRHQRRRPHHLPQRRRHATQRPRIGPVRRTGRRLLDGTSCDLARRPLPGRLHRQRRRRRLGQPHPRPARAQRLRRTGPGGIRPAALPPPSKGVQIKPSRRRSRPARP